MSYVTDLTKDQIKIYEERCRPDHGHVKNSQLMTFGMDLYSDTGFISDDDSLLDVCLKDDKTVTELLGEGGHELIGKTLLCFIVLELNQIKEKFPELYVDINLDNYHVERGDVYLGSQRCPFADKRTLKCIHDCQIPNYSNVDFTITNKITGESLKINPLIAHLIYYHHFYQGDIPHRFSPEKLIEFFNIKK